MESIKIVLAIAALVAVSNGTLQPKLTSGLVKKSGCTECDCGVPNVDNKIVGGQETKVNQYPWMALLEDFGSFICGGSLINDQYIMTASHCVKTLKTINFLRVKLMVHNQNEDNNGQIITRRVKEIILHPDYNENTINNDIALLKLNKKVDMVGKLRPVCLPEKKNQFVNYIAIVTGWGTTSQGGLISSPVLQEVKVPIITNEECLRLYNPINITENMLCAGLDEGGKDACQGDSGGPLHIQNKDHSYLEVAGIVSFGAGCAQPNYPGVYTRVNNYLSWIEENTADACYCGSN